MITAGDLARFVDSKEEFLERRVSEAMNANPKTAAVDDLAVEAVYLMEKHGIMALPVRDEDNRLAGIIHLHDLMRARVV